MALCVLRGKALGRRGMMALGLNVSRGATKKTDTVRIV
jgi:hypothetical protein